MLLLDLGHRDPRGPAQVLHLRRVVLLALPERLDVPPDLTQRPELFPGDLVLPGLQPGRLVQVLAVVDASGALPSPGLGPASVLRGLLAQQPPGPGRGLVPVD